MAKITLNNLADLRNPVTAASTINANNDLIESKWEKNLSRDGSSPNSMQADIDMDSNRILNLPEPSSPGEPVTLGMYTAGTEGTVVPIASKEEAEAGVENTKMMTPLRTKEAIDFQVDEGPGGPIAASAITFTPAGSISSSNVQSAIEEVALDAAAPIPATNVTFTPTGTISSTNVQAAIAEVATEAVAGTLPDNSVTFAKIQNINTQRVLGRFTTGVDDIEELTLDTTLQLTAGGVLRRAAITGAVDIPAGSNVASAGASTVADDSITNAKLANMANGTIKGRNTSGTNDPEDLPASSVREMLYASTSNLNNLMHNPDFGGDLSGWTTTGTVNVLSDHGGVSGAKYLSMDIGSNIIQNDADSFIAVEEGSTVEVSAYMRASSAITSHMRFTVWWYDEVNGTASSTALTTPVSTSWARYYYDLVVPADKRKMRIQTFHLTGSPATSLFIDQLSVRRVYTPHNIAKVNTFTANGTWVKEPWANYVELYLVGGGGGGGSGSRRSGQSGGGSGGASGGSNVSPIIVPASALALTEAVVVGLGGTGGASKTTDNTDGAVGTDGGDSSFGTGVTLIKATGGGGGLAGTATAGGAASSGGGSPIGSNGRGGGAGGASAAGTAGAASTGNAGAGGGGGGAGQAATLANANGGAGSTIPSIGALAGAGGIGSSKTNATSGEASAYVYGLGNGGGGGWVNIDGTAGAGANAAGKGAGGGGGGGSRNTFASGKGGDGTPGIVVVIQRAAN